MAKSLSERIAERMAKRKPNKRALNLAAFLANKSDIEDALKDRWSVRSIWETLKAEGKIQVSYQAFNNYVNNHINRSDKPIEKDNSTIIETKKIDDEEIKPEVKETNKSTEFTFNATPNKEDLI